MHEEPTDVSIIQLTQRERPADRFLASNAHQLNHGRRELSFISVVEIMEAWNPARELGLSIPQTFVRLFSNSEHQSILTKFEDALKGVNKILADQQSKLTSPICCSLALVSGDEVYLASIGQVSLMLLRNGRLSHLSADLKDGSNEFTTVTSGELTAADWLFVANNNLGELLEDLPIGDLNVATNNPSELSEFLKAKIGLEDPRILAGCCVRYSPAEGQLVTIYLDELDSLTPINLPKFSAPRISLPSVRLPGLAPAVSKLIEFTKRLNLRHWLLIICALIIISALGVGVSRLGRNNTHEVSSPTLVSQLAEMGQAEIRAFASSKITASAVSALSPADQALLSNMLTAANLSAVALPRELATLPSPIVAIDSPDGAKDELYLVDKSGQLWKWQNQVLSKIEQKQLISQPIGLVSFSATKILVSDQAGNVWYFDGKINQPQSLNMASKISTGGKLIQKFQKNLYLFSSSDSQIYRVANYDKELTSAVVSTKASLITNSPISDWVINGDIWTVNSAGKLLGLRRNSPVSIVSAEPLNGPFHLAALNEEVLAIDGRLISKLSVAGSSPTEKLVIADLPITDAVPNGSGGWFLVIDNKLYSLPTGLL